MLKIYCGTAKDGHKYLSSLAQKEKCSINYCNSLKTLINALYGFFMSKGIYYIVYDEKELKKDSDVKYFDSMVSKIDSIVVVLVENIKPTSAFYKFYKDKIKLHKKIKTIDIIALFKKDKYSILFIKDEEIVPTFYTIFYTMKRYKLIASILLGYILSGYMSARIALKYFVMTLD